MKLLELEIKNIRGIKSINITPQRENVVVFGPNGTGKSAIVDSIDFLLTGKISEEEKRKYEEAKTLRAKYRKLLSQVKKQIRFLRSSLRGKEAV